MRRDEAIDAVRAFDRAYLPVMSLMSQNYQGSGASVTEVRVMFEIRDHENCRARDIADALSLDKGYLSRMLDGMERAGYLRRSQSETDGRARVLALTEKGRSRVEDYERMGRDVVRNAVSGLTDGQCEELVGHMRAIERLMGLEGQGAGR